MLCKKENKAKFLSPNEINIISTTEKHLHYFTIDS